MDRKELGGRRLEQHRQALEQERRMGAVAAAREEAASERRLTRIRFVLGALLLAAHGGGEGAVARLIGDPRWGPALDAFVKDEGDRALFGLPPGKTG